MDFLSWSSTSQTNGVRKRSSAAAAEKTKRPQLGEDLRPLIVGWLPYAFSQQGRWRCQTGVRLAPPKKGPTGREFRRVTTTKAPALTASQTRKIPMRARLAGGPYI